MTFFPFFLINFFDYNGQFISYKITYLLLKDKTYFTVLDVNEIRRYTHGS